MTLFEPITLASGQVLPNRIAKAAMSEGMADAANHATPRLTELYRRWAGSGAGLLLSGNSLRGQVNAISTTDPVYGSISGYADLSKS